MRIRRGARSLLIAATVLALGASGCSTTPNASTDGTTSASGQISGLAPLDLGNVATETTSARAAVIGPEGGTVTTTAANGTTYRLDVPADAIREPTQIGAYPVTGLSGLPAAAKVLGGVQLVPDGLLLAAPATLTMTYPADRPITDRVALAWAGDADQLHRVPSVLDGRVVTLTTLHFSGYGDVETFHAQVTVTDANARAEDLLILHWSLRGSQAELKDDLRSWYAGVVKPALLSADSLTLGQPTVADADRIAAEYLSWLSAIDWARRITGNTAFSVSPELDDSILLAVNYLRDFYNAMNVECLKGAADPDIEPAFNWSREAFDVTVIRTSAIEELAKVSLATSVNQLDEPSLLADSCLKLVIDPDRSYSATKKGETGTLKVRAGFSLGDQLPRYGDPTHAVQVGWRKAGDEEWTFVPTDPTGWMQTDITWPAGLDSLTIELRVEFVHPPLNKISRSDLITSGPTGIVFRSDRGGGQVPQIWSMDSDGSSALPLTNDLAGHSSLTPDWSPDGSKIAFASNRAGGNPQIWVMDADGDHARQLTHFDAPCIWPTWSPDGRRIAYSSTNGDAEGRQRIFIIDLTSLVETQITDPVSGGGDLTPRWSPDGTKILFSAIHREGPGSGQQVYVIELSNPTVVKPLTTGDETVNAYNAAWSPDGTQIVFVQRVGTEISLAVMNADGLGPRAIFSLRPGSTPRPVWSPDGTLIAFTMPWSTNNAKQGIFTIDLKGENLTPLSPPTANETDPSWRR